MLKNIFIAAGLLLTQSAFGQQTLPHDHTPPKKELPVSTIYLWQADKKDNRHDIGLVVYKDVKNRPKKEMLWAMMGKDGLPRQYFMHDTLLSFAKGSKVITLPSENAAKKLNNFLDQNLKKHQVKTLH